MNAKQLGLDLETRLIGRWRAETAQVHRLLGIDVQAQFFVQFARQGLHRRFARVDLATGLHEGLGAAFAHQQGPAGRIDEQGSGDMDDLGHGQGFLNDGAGRIPEKAPCASSQTNGPLPSGRSVAINGA